MRLWRLVWGDQDLDVFVMTTRNTFMKKKTTSGFCWGNWMTGVFLPNRPHGQSFWINTSTKMSLDGLGGVCPKTD